MESSTLIHARNICVLTGKGSDEARARPLSSDAEGMSLRGGADSAQGVESRSQAATRPPRRKRAPCLWGHASRSSSRGVLWGAGWGKATLKVGFPLMPSPVPDAGNSEMSPILFLPPPAPTGGGQTQIKQSQAKLSMMGQGAHARLGAETVSQGVLRHAKRNRLTTRPPWANLGSGRTCSLTGTPSHTGTLPSSLGTKVRCALGALQLSLSGWKAGLGMGRSQTTV